MSALCARVSASVTDIHSKLESRGQQNWMHFVKKNKIRRGGMPGKMPDRMIECANISVKMPDRMSEYIIYVR